MHRSTKIIVILFTLSAAFCGTSLIMHGQIAAPQINLTGNIGCQGFPCLNSGTLIFSTDANHTMTAQESSATGGIKITSGVSLTATRSLILPTAYGKLQFVSIENATTGGQSITVIGQGGTGITIPNGQSATGVWYDGTNVTGTLPGSGGAVFTVSNSDSTLTVSPTTGAVVTSLNLAHANTWTANQTFAGSGPPITIPEAPTNSGVSANTVIQALNSNHRLQFNPNNTGWLNSVGIATAGTANNCPKLAANGIDLVDSGSPCGGTITSSATINTANSQVQADSIVYATTSVTSFGDSITAGVGDYSGVGYVGYMAADYGVGNSNQSVPGDNVQDETWHIFTTLNPGDSGNGIVTSMIGTNNSGVTTGYQAVHMAGHAWAAMSSTNKILAGSPMVTLTGTTTADTTWANANGITCTSGPCTATYSAAIGSPSFFYMWFKELASGGTFSVTVDGSPATDTISSGTTISGNWGVAPAHQSATVGMARFAASNTGTASQHPISVTFSTGATLIGFGFPPTTRYRGVSAPRILVGGVPPQQNNAGGSGTTMINALNLITSKTLVSDGLNTPFIDTYAGLDPVLDFQTGSHFQATFSGTTMTVTTFVSGAPIAAGQAFGTLAGGFSGTITALGSGTGGTGTYTISTSISLGSPTEVYSGIQGCPGSTNPGEHPNHCGHIHLAHLFESLINATPIQGGNPNIPGPLNVNTPAATSLAGFQFLEPHSFGDAVIAGTRECSGMECGTKQYSGGRGFGFGIWVSSSKENGIGFLTGSGTSEGDWIWPIWATSDGTWHSTNITATGATSSATYATASNCSSSASPAVCGSAASGSVAMPSGTGPRNIVVNTTAVTANSQIIITPDESLGTRLSVTCSTTSDALLGQFAVTARVAGTSFTLVNTATSSNPDCLSYTIIN